MLSATSELLTEVGYDGLSVEVIASRAGVHKTTVYRRWPTLPDLVADAVSEYAEQHVTVPDTGDLRSDLRALARDVVASLSSPGGLRRSTSIVAAAADAPEVASRMHSVWSGRMEATRVIVERAVERGEIGPHIEPQLIIESLVAPIWLRVLVTGEPIDEGLADRLAALTTAGAMGSAAGGAGEGVGQQVRARARRPSPAHSGSLVSGRADQARERRDRRP